VAKISTAYPFLAHAHARRLILAYGTRTRLPLRNVSRARDLGRRYGADLYEAEVNYLMHHEWAETAEDVLWRRNKLGVWILPAEAEGLGRWMQTHDYRRQTTPAT
jgi:glycerol-3-phosphate dehydrogenase